MTVSQIISQARFNRHITSTQLSDAAALSLLNMVFKKVVNRIVTHIDEDFFYEYWTHDARISENGEYPYPVEDETATPYYGGMKKVKRVYIKPKGTDTDYTSCTEIDLKTLAFDWSYYLTNQPSYNPIYYIADKSFFIAPQFIEDDLGTSPNEQIKIYGIRTLKELETTDTEANMPIPDDYHEVLVRGLEAEIARTRLLTAEKERLLMEFEQGLDELILYLGDRTGSVTFRQLPDDKHLQY